ncbi:geranylgeranylglycerol-phosphate geranylgeranyltransferase [Tenacibaculum finnmarkense genomovar finnmarkense]|uniref:Ubiquinone biosynthesis protein UbiA n=1 Tax=Tenacibaculum finnmarkense genomovar ulcerans TaxID=2781388 RepID=A0A2I2M9Y1_9FLAO|nr:geranylgeranylglycerol-phosphate geranylgeranyltransferase [Tenacibaculum finnmarkense]ALU75702.1 ubiquinone biosynthesis protein UbiA [Tenacibaculum dicentrarchi]MBE7633130.1 ubiquinone biosynthesis protein UbiA [Tenacibaculum finnmarkense genomovar ulcerans]MBE7644785.1 ubiquinone biosynthesis protein UbiA [Tenacibaculum finnmarkense genomovar ulcerans]MBE7646953.1 ubiquinone biosynthesis protein UbiA [Tenacibaculum finnmarkense genomovar ulcerans]MBE7691741.1 ubiquinone biosynthesis prot
MDRLSAKIIVKKLFSLLSVVRGYNILVLIAAQYLAAIFIFSDQKSIKPVLFDWHLLYLVIATICVVAAGYIINNFYDKNADKINRPIKTSLDSYVKQETKLSLYFFLNFTGFGFGLLVSWRAAFFFAVYIFSIWLYSHKLKKHPFTGLISVTTLTILPFFVLFVHYKNFSKVIFVHAIFLFLIILIRELIKNLENIKGAIINNYNTFPVKYGEKNTKKLIILLMFLTLAPICILFNYPAIEYMKYYFYLAAFVLIFIGFYTWKASKTNQYRLLHNILKVLLLIGVFSLLFIDKTLILDKVVTALD